MSANPVSLTDIGIEADDFRSEFQTLLLATVDDDGTPVASYAPFALINDCYGIYVSELAAHTANLISGRPASLLFIESEENAAHLFARRRLTISCMPQVTKRDSSEFNVIVDALQSKFGEFMTHMRTLKDFHAVRLEPTYASYVKGFAQAYEFNNADFKQVRHINDKGHRDD